MLVFYHSMTRKQATLVYNERSPQTIILSAPIPIILINNLMHSVRGTLLLKVRHVHQYQIVHDGVQNE